MQEGKVIALDNQHKAKLYKLNYKEQSITIMSYGARLIEWLVPCRQAKNNQLNLVLNHENFEHYLADSSYMGAMIGPIPNRLQNAEFYLAGKKHTLEANEGRNCLHSSNYAFSELDFKLVEQAENYLVLEHKVIAGQGHTDGSQKVQIKFTLLVTDRQYSLQLTYKFISEQKSVCNICNHSYFSLWDHTILSKHNLTAQEALKSLEVNIPADFYTPTDANLLVTGEIKSVASEAIFDFRKTKALKDGLNALASTKARGYDHNFLLERDYMNFADEAGQYWSKKVKFTFPQANLQLTCRTTEPGAQFYTANYLPADKTQNGEDYGEQTAFCFECQAIPNSLHFSHLSELKLEAKQAYTSLTELSFQELSQDS